MSEGAVKVLNVGRSFMIPEKVTGAPPTPTKVFVQGIIAVLVAHEIVIASDSEIMLEGHAVSIKQGTCTLFTKEETHGPDSDPASIAAMVRTKVSLSTHAETGPTWGVRTPLDRFLTPALPPLPRLSWPSTFYTHVCNDRDDGNMNRVLSTYLCAVLEVQSVDEKQRPMMTARLRPERLLPALVERRRV